MDVANTPTLRTRVYIDGYNLYYGCLKGTSFKWLDLFTLFEQRILPSILHARQGQPVRAELAPLGIKYFTAMIVEKAARAPDSVSSQARYHTALEKLYQGRLEIIKGYYSVIPVNAKMIDPDDPGKWPRDCDSRLVWKLEEKQTDVNLALHAYHDAITGQVDQVVMVTNDTDIAPAMAMIRKHTPVVIGLVVPTTDHQRIPNTELANLSHWIRSHIRQDELAASQLPRVIPGRKPTSKPLTWYAHADKLIRALSLAESIRGSRHAAFQWLQTPSPFMSGKSPLALIEEGHGDHVLAYIMQWIAENQGGNDLKSGD